MRVLYYLKNNVGFQYFTYLLRFLVFYSLLTPVLPLEIQRTFLVFRNHNTRKSFSWRSPERKSKCPNF